LVTGRIVLERKGAFAEYDGEALPQRNALHVEVMNA
jgi:hypothetical protein